MKDNAVFYPNVLEFTHWVLAASATEDKHLDNTQNKGREEGKAKNKSKHWKSDIQKGLLA